MNQHKNLNEELTQHIDKICISYISGGFSAMFSTSLCKRRSVLQKQLQVEWKLLSLIRSGLENKVPQLVSSMIFLKTDEKDMHKIKKVKLR